MNALSEWLRRVWYLVNRRRFEAELLRDMEAHLERLDRPARFGNLLKLREEARDAWGWNWLDGIVADVRVSVRTLRRTPLFTVTAASILAFGVGVNLALFQVVNATLIRPLGLKDLDSLVRFDRRTPSLSSNGVPGPMAAFVEAESKVLSAVMVRHVTEVEWGEAGGLRVDAAFVSANWFDEFGATAARGRLLGPVDAAASASPTVVVSFGFWQRHLAGRADLVGSIVRINDRPAVVVGVVAAGFQDVDLRQPAVWAPITQIAQFVPGSRVAADWNSPVEMFARLGAGVSVDVARASVEATLAALREREPAHVAAGEWLDPATGRARFLSARERQQVWLAVFTATTLAVLVLVVACLNLSNLAFSRALSRVREMSIRSGLGAGRARIVGHLLTESALVALLGALGGLALGAAAARILARRLADTVVLDLSFDWRLGLVMLAAAVLAMLAVGLMPAWKIGRSNLALAVRDGADQVTQGLQATRFRSLLVIGQIGGSCLLLVFTLQLVRSFQRALDPSPGFDYANVAVLDPSLGAHGLEPSGARAYWSTVRLALETQPDVEEMALVSYPPLYGGGGSASRYRSTPQLRIAKVDVEPSFFSVMRIPLLSGRLFDRRDDPQSPVIVSRRVALEMYGAIDVVGRGFPIDAPEREIIGVVGDAHFVNLRAPDAAEMYMPLGRDTAGASLLVRARTDPAPLLAPLRAASRSADPRVLPHVRMMRDDYLQLLRAPRLASALAASVSALALGLACLGVTGVVAHAARLRRKEIGIRLALGASRGAITRTLFQRTVRAAAIGLTLGLGGAAALTRLLSGAPFYVESRDPLTYVVAAVTLAVAGLVAVMPPIIGALRADPLNALREN
jgi:predicted permease